MTFRARFSSARPSALLLALTCAAACTSPGAKSKGTLPHENAPDASASENSHVGSNVSVPLSPREAAAEASLEAERHATMAMTTNEFEKRYAPSFRDALPYSPLAASDLKLIETKTRPLTDAERARLSNDGFVLLPSSAQPMFGLDYADAFRKHLPVFISADAILFAMHKSFDALLERIEGDTMVRDLGLVIDRMRDALKEGKLAGASAETRVAIDDYLAVADALLQGTEPAPILSGHAAEVKKMVDLATAAKGMARIRFFGNEREFDFSQLKPRGHYQESPALQQYFRATMWLSRTDFRVIDLSSDGRQVFGRQQLEAAIALRDAMDEKAIAAWTRIDRVVGAFVGEPDEMNLPGLESLMRELGIAHAADLAAKNDDAIAAVLGRTGLGHQRVASRWVEQGPEGGGARSLPTSFALMNQRYTLDSHVFSNLVFDRVRSSSRRMMPDPLDVAFAALGNDGAAALLRGELDRYDYAPDLHMMRFLASAHGDEYWNANLYTTWSSALRALSPSEDALRDAKKSGLPSVASTRVWNTRILNTQLASWAELRHDTVLYAKESETAVPTCEFPDAYVEPYPEFFQRVALHARLGKKLVVDALGESKGVAELARGYFTRLEDVATQLEQMARQEREGKPFTASQMKWVNTMISERVVGCGSIDFSGWYGSLFVDRSDITKREPTVADVHTQPADANGNTVGRVLHVATGFTNPIVLTVDSCHGPHAYVGYVSSYYERTTSKFQRLDDATWLRDLASSPPPRPAWMHAIAPTQ